MSVHGPNPPGLNAEVGLFCDTRRSAWTCACLTRGLDSLAQKNFDIVRLQPARGHIRISHRSGS